MQALFGLFIFSLLLATAACSTCGACVGLGDTCSGVIVTCAAGQDTCATAVGEVTAGGQTQTAVIKSCAAMADCIKLKPGDPFTVMENKGKIKTVTCGAAPSPASFLSALVGFLLLKIFF